MVYLVRLKLACAALAALAACAMDKPEVARAFVDRWAWAGPQTYFASARACTVGVYQLESPGLRNGVTRVFDTRQGVSLLRQGRAVAFADRQVTPDALAQAVMSMDLHTGLGLVSTVTGPRACMSDDVALNVHRILTQEGVITVYDPGENVLLLLDMVRGHAVFLRGTT